MNAFLLLTYGVGTLLASELSPAHLKLGIVVGYNGDTQFKEPPLHFADDDAVKNAQLLADLGTEFVLLTELDQDSAEWFPRLQPTSPTLSAIDEAIVQINTRIAEAGPNTITSVYFFFSGHGEVENGEGYVQLKDARLSRQDFLERIRRISATHVHVIIDACKAYHLVFARGPQGQRQVARGPLLDSTQLPSHVGLLLSSSFGQDSHEWEAFRSGVFSHEVRSALRGAADIDGDGLIQYEEVGAFVYTANQSIAPKFRPQFVARGPSETSPVVDLRDTAPGLQIAPGVSRKLRIEDAQGLRLADMHLDATFGVAMRLPKSRPIYIHDDHNQTEYTLTDESVTQLVALSPQIPRAQQRGAREHAFLGLFATAFGARAKSAYANSELAARLTRSTPESSSWTWLKPALGIAGAGVLVGSAAFGGVSLYERSQMDEYTSQTERFSTNERIRDYNNIAIGTLIVGGALLGGYFIWEMLSTPESIPLEEELELYPNETPITSVQGVSR